MSKKVETKVVKEKELTPNQIMNAKKNELKADVSGALVEALGAFDDIEIVQGEAIAEYSNTKKDTIIIHANGVSVKVDFTAPKAGTPTYEPTVE